MTTAVTDTASRADDALSYAARGWPVFPLHHVRPNGRCSCTIGDCAERKGAGKHPRTRHGLHDASLDPDTIRGWWQHWPAANIGIRTGIAFDVLDIDGEPGETAVRPYVDQAGPMPPGPRTHTGGGGWHYLFIPLGFNNRAGLIDHVDWRGAGGYIVAPPSGHLSGRRYRWTSSPELPIPAAPAWLVELLTPKPVERRNGTYTAARAADGNSVYGQRALDAELAELGRAVQGNRNHTLNTVTFNLAQLVAGGELDETTTLEHIQAVAGSVGLGETEVAATMKSGWHAGYAQPRTAPELRVITRNRPQPRPPAGADQEPGPPAPGDVHDTPPPPDPTPPQDAAGGIPADERWTDLGNAKRLVAAHGHRFHWVPAWGRWLVWDGRRWAEDETGHIDRAAKNIARGLLAEAGRIPDTELRKIATKWAIASEGVNRIDGMIRLARTEPGVPVTPAQLDANHTLLNAANGTVDLTTGTIRLHNRADLITKLTDIVYDPDAPAPVWDAFLTQVLPDADLRHFFQRAVGYSFTGLTTEQILLILWGAGANGKSTACERVRKVAGDYGIQVDPELLTDREQHETGTARLKGARLAIASEGDQGARLAEGTVKRLTGGDRITARFMRQDHFEFDATHTLWMVTNHKPIVKGTDHAIWRRIRLVPFTVTIPDDQQDKDLGAKLDAEAAGILTWAVKGAHDWITHGLTAPTEVILATAAYRAEMDTIGDFLDECTVQAPTATIGAQGLFAAYTEWCADNGERPLSQHRLGAALTERGFDRTRVGASRRWHWLGIGLIDETRNSPDDQGEHHQGHIDEPF